MHPDAFDLVLIGTTIALLFGLVRIAYELGLDDGWEQSGRWADEHIGPVAYTLDGERIAARHDADELAERTYPYRGEIS